MRKQKLLLSKSKLLLLAENTKMSKSKLVLLAENTKMRKQKLLLSKSNAILLTKFDFIYFPDAAIGYSYH
jgi:hypothetical protein